MMGRTGTGYVRPTPQPIFDGSRTQRATPHPVNGLLPRVGAPQQGYTRASDASNSPPFYLGENPFGERPKRRNWLGKVMGL